MEGGTGVDAGVDAGLAGVSKGSSSTDASTRRVSRSGTVTHAANFVLTSSNLFVSGSSGIDARKRASFNKSLNCGCVKIGAVAATETSSA